MGKAYSDIDLQKANSIRNGGFAANIGTPSNVTQREEWYDSTDNKRKYRNNLGNQTYATESYVTNQIANLEHPQGSYDASDGSLPTQSDREVPTNPLRAGDFWIISVTGTITGLGELLVGDKLQYTGGTATVATNWIVIPGSRSSAEGALISDSHTVNLVANTDLTVSSSTITDIKDIVVFINNEKIDLIDKKKHASNNNQAIIRSTINVTGAVVTLVGI